MRWCILVFLLLAGACGAATTEAAVSFPGLYDLTPRDGHSGTLALGADGSWTENQPTLLYSGQYVTTGAAVTLYGRNGERWYAGQLHAPTLTLYKTGEAQAYVFTRRGAY